jgi:SSS family solute:Na+ symporter
MQVGPVDYLIIGIYFVFTIGIGFALKKQMVSSEDFFLAGHKIPSWVTGLAFLSANLGAIEVMGMAANGAQYGIMTAHFYWLGAIPAMVFLALYMMPFYYCSNVRSVPEYLKKRFNEPTRALNAVSFALMTVLMSGINLFAMALVFKLLLHWDMNASIFIAAGVVLVYTYLGGLTSSIYNEVMQFFLIVFGLLPISIIGLCRVGGWEGLVAKFPNPGFGHLWAGTATANNGMGVDWIGLVSGLGFVLSFGYWCTDFLVIQRALAAEDLKAAQRSLFPIAYGFARAYRCSSFTRTRQGSWSEFIQPGDASASYEAVSEWHVRRWFDRHASQFHVGDGRQRHGIQHCLDIRSLPELHRKE